jgi:hypothetical protein
MNIKETMSGIGAGIIPIALIALWINGCNHGIKKHDIDPWSANFFVCWYYGAEKFWHKTDTTELNENVKLAFYLLMADLKTVEPKKQIEFSDAKKSFKRILKTCEDNEIEYIKEGAKTLLDIKDKFETQVYLAIINYKRTKQFSLSQSDSITILTKKLSKYGLDNEMNALSKSIEKLTNEFQSQLEERPDILDHKDLRDEVLKKDLEKGFQARRELFDNLFK